MSAMTIGLLFTYGWVAFLLLFVVFSPFIADIQRWRLRRRYGKRYAIRVRRP